MLSLYLLAAHLVGDFIFQTRWQAAGKFTDRALRKRHVWTYAIPFIPLATWRSWGGSTWHEQRGVVFICLLVLLHFATDSRRFYSTLGDVVAWQFSTQRHVTIMCSDDVLKVGDSVKVGAHPLDPTGRVSSRHDGYAHVRLDLEPNPWTPVPILIDQTLHVVQLAVLGGLFLS